MAAPAVVAVGASALRCVTLRYIPRVHTNALNASSAIFYHIHEAGPRYAHLRIGEHLTARDKCPGERDACRCDKMQHNVNQN